MFTSIYNFSATQHPCNDSLFLSTSSCFLHSSFHTPCLWPFPISLISPLVSTFGFLPTLLPALSQLSSSYKLAVPVDMPSTSPGSAGQLFSSSACLPGAQSEWKGFALTSVLSGDHSLTICSLGKKLCSAPCSSKLKHAFLTDFSGSN